MYDVPFRAHLKRVPAVLLIFIPYAIKVNILFSDNYLFAVKFLVQQEDEQVDIYFCSSEHLHYCNTLVLKLK